MSNPVRLSLNSTFEDSRNAAAMGRMYLPDDDIGNRWAVGKFTWLPSDESLAALPFPLAPDSDAMVAGLDVDPSGGPAAYYAAAVLDGIPDEINPGGESLGFVAGQISSMDLRIIKGRVQVDLSLSRRLPAILDGTQIGITVDDVAASFPTIAADDVDPDVSAYDTRLVHPPA